LKENESQVNVITTIDHIVNEPNNIKDKTHIEPVGDTPVKIGYDSKWINDYSSDYELREESSYTIKREHDELFYGIDSKCPKLFNDTNDV
jgi:hypothetical protein